MTLLLFEGECRYCVFQPEQGACIRSRKTIACCQEHPKVELSVSWDTEVLLSIPDKSIQHPVGVNRRQLQI
jgi:hypothetical protein